MATNETQAQALMFRLSPQQDSAWTRDAVVQADVELPAHLSAEAIREALERVVSRHEILRTTFARSTGMSVPMQLVNDELPPRWVETDDPFAPDLAVGPVVCARLRSEPDSPHLLSLSIPAVCADGASLGVLVAELAALLGLTDTALAEEPLQYADYAEWRHELLADEEGSAEGRAFWAEQPPASTLGLLFAPGAGAQADADHLIAIPVDAETISERAAAFRTTEAIFLEACWHACIARVTGESELVLGTTLDGRSHDEIRDAIGPFSQLLPLRTRIEAETTVAELVDQVQRAHTAAARRQDYADRAFLAAFGDTCRVGFAAVAAPAAGTARLFSLAGGATPPPLELRLTAGVATLHADRATVAAEDAERLARRLAALVEDASPERAVADLELASPEEREQLVAAASAPLPPPSDRLVHERFEVQAGRVPDSVAVHDGSRSLTYRELDERANRLAHHLRSLGVGPSVAVGLCMDRSVEMVEAVLAILKAGGAYVPLNFEHPPARLAHQLGETNAPVLVTQEALLDRLPRYDGAVVCVDRDRDAFAACPASAPETATAPDDLVYVMYTSGSTGLPKGVEVTHRNLESYVAAVSRVLELPEAAPSGLGFAAVSAISTDLGNTSVFGALLSGGTLHLVPPDVATDGARFAAYRREHAVDVLKITPSQLRALVAGAGIESVLPRRWLVLGGEALPWELAAEVLAPGTCRLLNHYGPTETTVGACTYEVTKDTLRRSATVPVGRPLANSRGYVLDRRLRPLPTGVPGELCLAGHGVARGYAAQPELTAEVFVADPVAADGRAYRTGDRARVLADGAIEFLGRLDQQVKIRGYRVEPGEIEAVLRQHPDVREATVAARESETGEQALVGYVVSAAEPDVEELQRFLRETLPAYMVPARFLRLDALPLSASGKVDRASLPEPGESARTTEYVAPRTEVERSLVEIWEELLGVEQIGVLDDFFALGGHSLLATQVVIRIRRTHADIPLHSIFDEPTVAGLAAIVERAVAEQEPVRG